MTNGTVEIDKSAPMFCLPDKENNSVCLGDFKGSWVILYFYPKDNTQGCTLEGIDFSAYVEKFKEKNTLVVGISPDNIISHKKFADKHSLKILLLSDTDRSVAEKYGVWKLKKMYGRESYGIERSTFLIDMDGIVRYAWTKVKVSGHVEEVFNKLIEKQTGS